MPLHEHLDNPLTTFVKKRQGRPELLHELMLFFWRKSLYLIGSNLDELRQVFHIVAKEKRQPLKFRECACRATGFDPNIGLQK